MYVDRLELHDFRNYPAAELTIGPGITVFQGANGQGKTNLVEAIEYLSRLGSHRVFGDAPLVRSGCDQAVIRGEIVAGLSDNRRLRIDVEINPGRANRARINRGDLPKASDLIGALRTVVFSPEDLAVVKGDPATRRRFLDDLVTSRWPRMLGVRQDYDRVLKQRNALLKSLVGARLDEDGLVTLEVWDEQFSRLGAELLAARLDTLHELLAPAQQAYQTIAPVNNQANANYQSTICLPEDGADLVGAFRESLVAKRAEELSRGLTLIGPHRDDIALMIGELPAKGYASHGESWSLALALRLGAFHLLRADDIEAVLILDDVFAELDATRRQRLADAVVDAEQLLITAAVPEDVPARLAGRRFTIQAGTITTGENDDDQQ